MQINRMFVLGMNLTAGVVLAGGVSAAAPSEVRDRVLELTGGKEARIVWVRNTTEVTGAIMALDTASGKERVLVPGAKGARVENLCFTFDGQRVIYTRTDEKTAYAVAFDGLKNGKLSFKRPGFNYVLGLSRDAVTGEEYIYVGDRLEMTDAAFARTQEQLGGWTAGWGDRPEYARGGSSAVYRYSLKRLDAEPELVWDKMPVTEKVVFSTDGKYMVAEMPWPRLVVATLPNGDMRQYELGCCPMLTPTGVLCRLGGEHQNIWMSTWEGAYYAHPHANTMPGLSGKRDIWRPKLAVNDGRFLVIKSYQEDSAGGNIYFGRFSADFRQIEGWVQITDSKGPAEAVNKEPAAWIAPKEPLASAGQASDQ